MASSSGRSVICLLHIGGHFVNGEDGYPQYVGGSIISRTIKEGMTYEELKTIVVTIVGGGAEIGDISMKFRLSGDETLSSSTSPSATSFFSHARIHSSAD